MKDKKCIMVLIIAMAIIATLVYQVEQPQIAREPLPTAVLLDEPANVNASENAHKVLDYLWSVKNATGTSDRTIVVQFSGFADSGISSDYAKYITGLYNDTGEYPAILSVSYGYWSEEIDYHVAIDGVNPYLTTWWSNGGLVSIMPHYRNPLCDPTLPSYSATWGCGDEIVAITGTLQDILNPTKNAYTIMRNEMNRVAYGLQVLEDAGVVVLWRPFHEMNFGWYWQGKRPQADYIALWRYEFDYLTRVKGLSNLLYVYGPNYIESWATDEARKATYYYPGDDYVDMVGLSIYDVAASALNTNGGWDNVRTINKPRGVYEFGPPPGGNYDYNALMTVVKSYGDIQFWGHWSQGWGLVDNPNPSIVMDDIWSITRDEVAWDAEQPTVVPPTATKTPTASRTNTPITNTPTKTSTSTVTKTATLTKTATTTYTLTSTLTATKTKTQTPSKTPTLTPSMSLTPTITQTPSRTPAATKTTTNTPTPTKTPVVGACVVYWSSVQHTWYRCPRNTIPVGICSRIFRFGSYDYFICDK